MKLWASGDFTGLSKTISWLVSHGESGPFWPSFKGTWEASSGAHGGVEGQKSKVLVLEVQELEARPGWAPFSIVVPGCMREAAGELSSTSTVCVDFFHQAKTDQDLAA
jgi:hypothetical protein